MAKTVACGLNEIKDDVLIKYMDKMNGIGMSNATLIKIALYKFMNENSIGNVFNVQADAQPIQEDVIAEKSVQMQQEDTQKEIIEKEEIVEYEEIVEEPKIVIEEPEFIIEEPKPHNPFAKSPFVQTLQKVEPKR